MNPICSPVAGVLEHGFGVVPNLAETGAHPDRFKQRGLGGIDRDGESEAKPLDRGLLLRPPARPVGHDGARHLGVQLLEETPHPSVRRRQEWLASGERCPSQVRDERSQLLKEALVIGVGEGRPVFPMAADGRGQVAIALNALKVAAVGEVELHAHRPAVLAEYAKTVEDPRVRVGAAFRRHLLATRRAPQRIVMTLQRRLEARPGVRPPDVAERGVADPPQGPVVSTACPHLAVRAEEQVGRGGVAGGGDCCDLLGSTPWRRPPRRATSPEGPTCPGVDPNRQSWRKRMGT